jgi:hypothetical protein
MTWICKPFWYTQRLKEQEPAGSGTTQISAFPQRGTCTVQHARSYARQFSA